MALHDLVLTMAVSLFVIGVTSISAGVFTLFFKATNKDLRVIAQQATRLAQKGIAEDVAGLVGNASALIDSMNQLVRTASGVGLALVISGLVMTAFSAFLLFKIF